MNDCNVTNSMGFCVRVLEIAVWLGTLIQKQLKDNQNGLVFQPNGTVTRPFSYVPLKMAKEIGRETERKRMADTTMLFCVGMFVRTSAFRHEGIILATLSLF